MPCNTCNSNCTRSWRRCGCSNSCGCNNNSCGSSCGCNSCGGSYARPVNFGFRKLSIINGIPLSNAVFQLFANGVVYATAVSDTYGAVRFGCLPPGTYTLAEVVAPPGYEPYTTTHTVVVFDGRVTVDGLPANNFIITNAPLPTPEFSITKIDSFTGLPLAGATFLLRDASGGLIRTVESDAAGLVYMGTLSPGTYQLTEYSAPAGYTPDTVTRLVAVANDGTIAIDGQPAAGYTIGNAPTGTNTFTFSKVIAGTTTPLAGAVFQLITASGTSAGTGTSSATGAVTFGNVPAGSYTMREIDVPDGYVLDGTTIYTVTVAADGTTIINGAPAADLVVENTPL